MFVVLLLKQSRGKPWWRNGFAKMYWLLWQIESEISGFDSIEVNFLLSKSQQWQGMGCVMCIPQRLGPVEVLPSQSELAQIVLGVNVRLADEESASEWGTGWEDLGARPGSAGHATLPHSVDQNSVTHTQLSVRGRLGWWSLCVSSRKGKQGVSLRHRRI